MNRVILVTGNVKKAQEALRLLRVPDGVKVSVATVDLPELQGSAEEIVQAKVVAAATQLGVTKDDPTTAILVEDVSMELPDLGGFPGPYIKAFWQGLGNNGMARVAAKLSAGGEPVVAIAKCTYGLWYHGGAIKLFTGETRGCIVPPRGPEVFGWDAIFQPEGSLLTFAEMAPEVKTLYSHRARALDFVSGFLHL